jgi:hypothetical protein
VYHSEVGDVYMLIYVDDFTIAASSRRLLDAAKEGLAARFNMKDLGNIDKLLGFRVHVDRVVGTISVSQAPFAESILQRYGFDQSRPVLTPIVTGQEYRSTAGQPITCTYLPDDPADVVLSTTTFSDLSEGSTAKRVPFREAVGSLMYLATRPDISFAVNLLARRFAAPNEIDDHALRHLLRYVKGTTKLALVYRRDNGEGLVGYADADFANDPVNRRSTSGVVFFYSGAPISFFSRRQSTIAVSTGAAEYYALEAATREATHLRQLFADLRHPIEGPVPIYSDSQVAVQWAQLWATTERNKHVEVSFHFVREMHERQLTCIEYIPGNRQPADVLTKGLKHVDHDKAIKLLGLVT